MGQAQGKGWIEKISILQEVDLLCRKNQLQYTLFMGTMLSQYMEMGESDWLLEITIALLYPDYLRLLEIIEKHDILYAFNNRNSENFNGLYSWICKDSRVKLPINREKDKPYYAHHIAVYPIFYIGDTEEEYRKIVRKARCHLKCFTSVAPVPFRRGIKWKVQGLKKGYWCKKRDSMQSERAAFFEFLSERGTVPSKYVWYPAIHKQRGAVRLAGTYEKVEECHFAGLDVFCVQDKELLLDKWYSRKKREEVRKRPLNKAVSEGPETVRRIQLVALENLVEFDRLCRQHSIHYILSCGTLLGAVRHKGFIPWDDDIDVFILEEEWRKFEREAKRDLDESKFFLKTQESDEDDNLIFYQLKRNGTVYIKERREEYNTHRGIALDIIPSFNSPNSRILFWIQDKASHFFKTMTWAHLGWKSVRKRGARLYYRVLAKVPNKISYRLFYRIANCVKTPSPYLVYLCALRNPYHKGFNQRKYFEETCEIEFEGHLFPVPKEYKEYLGYMYGNDYLKMVTPSNRVARHLPNKIELGDLYSFDE